MARIASARTFATWLAFGQAFIGASVGNSLHRFFCYSSSSMAWLTTNHWHMRNTNIHRGPTNWAGVSPYHRWPWYQEWQSIKSLSHRAQLHRYTLNFPITHVKFLLINICFDILLGTASANINHTVAWSTKQHSQWHHRRIGTGASDYSQRCRRRMRTTVCQIHYLLCLNNKLKETTSINC